MFTPLTAQTFALSNLAFQSYQFHSFIFILFSFISLSKAKLNRQDERAGAENEVNFKRETPHDGWHYRSGCFIIIMDWQKLAIASNSDRFHTCLPERSRAGACLCFYIQV